MTLPLEQLINSELRGRLMRFSEESDDNAFIAGQADCRGSRTPTSAASGGSSALIDTRFMAQRAAAEADFRRRVAGRSRAAPVDRRSVDDLANAAARDAPALPRLLHARSARAAAGRSSINWAEQLVRGAQERPKANAERLPEYGDARLAQVENGLLADAPTYPALDEVQLAWWLSKMREILTVDDPRVAPLLGKESPEALAARLARGTKLGDPAVRKALWEGGLPARRRRRPTR